MNKKLISLLATILIVFVAPTILQDVSAERPIDVLIYKHLTNASGTADSARLSLLESNGYTVVTRASPINSTEIHDSKIVILSKNTNYLNSTTIDDLKRYVYNGGGLLLLVDTEYQYCIRSDPTPACNYDFTGDAFGFKFDGSVQYSTIYPAANQTAHPIWTTPNAVSSFTDWCCDAYIGEIIDTENITVLSTVSGQSYKPSGYYTVQDVPAIIVNDNPDFNGGMVIGAGQNMILGWQTPDLRLFENTVKFMLSNVPDSTVPTLIVPEAKTFEATGPLSYITQEMLGTVIVTDSQDPNPFVGAYGIAVTVSITAPQPFLIHNASSFPLGTSVITWVASDASDNVSAKTQIIKVQDTVPPVILVPADITFSATGNFTALTGDDYGTAHAIDIVDPAPTVTSNAPLLFHVGNTTIIWTATDSSGNAVNATQTVTLTPAFKTIRDSFNNGTNWETYSMVSDYVPISGPDYTTFSNYAFTIEQQDGNPSPSARISGDGFTSYFAIQRNVTLSDLGENDLFVGIDYKATSATSASSVTNAKIELLDGDGSILYSNWLSRGGTVNTGWSTFSQNVTDAVAGSGIITIRLGLNDGWIANWSQNAYFDNLYVGTTPSTADQVSSPQEEMSPIQILSERIAQADDTELCRIASEGLPYSDDLISYYNRTATC